MFVNSENSKTSDPHRLLLNLSNNMHWESNEKYVALTSLRIYYKWKNIKRSYKNNKFSLIYLEYIVNHHKHKLVTDNHPIRKYVNKIENKVKIKIIWNF